MIKYGLDDKPGIGHLFLYGLQWWVVSLPCVVIMGVVAARLHFTDVGSQVLYVQKLFGAAGLALLAQIYLGHRLPLVLGPATILLVGLTSSLSLNINTLYTSIMIGGALLALTAASGFLSKIRPLFTPRIVTVILILIALTLCPTLLNLVLDSGDRKSAHLVFALALVLAMLLANKHLRGVWKSLTVFFGLALGSASYFFIFGFTEPEPLTPALVSSFFIDRLDFNLGSILSFIFCYLALSINELGSIESVGHMLAAGDMNGRVKRGAAVEGLANVAAGAMGVIGSVSYSLSAGLISATGCASRHTMLPAGVGLVACAFFPEVVRIFTLLPGAVMGALLLYLMAAQLAGGLSLLVQEKSISHFNDGLIVALPLMMGIMISFAPKAAFDGFPELLRPILANGFIVGTILVIILEHVIFSRGKKV